MNTFFDKNALELKYREKCREKGANDKDLVINERILILGQKTDPTSTTYNFEVRKNASNQIGASVALVENSIFFANQIGLVFAKYKNENGKMVKVSDYTAWGNPSIFIGVAATTLEKETDAIENFYDARSSIKVETFNKIRLNAYETWRLRKPSKDINQSKEAIHLADFLEDLSSSFVINGSSDNKIMLDVYRNEPKTVAGNVKADGSAIDTYNVVHLILGGFEALNMANKWVE